MPRRTEFVYVEEKRCSSGKNGCGQIKNRIHFSKDSHAKDGLQHLCNDCRDKRNKLYKQSHKEYFKQKGKENYHKEDNHKRYLKTRDNFLKRKKDWSQSSHGRLYELYNSAKHRSLNKNIPIDIDLNWLEKLYSKQEGKCLLTGFDLVLINTAKSGYNPYSPSIDRIDSTKGYTKDNARLVCTAVNIALNVWGDSHLEKICKCFLSDKIFLKENKNIKDFSGAKSRLKDLISSAKRRSVSKKLNVDIDYEWAENNFLNQNGSCLLTGIPFDLISNLNRIGRYNPFAPSLDRIDPGKGYTKNNTRIVCNAINIALNNWGDDFFAQLAKAFLNKKNNI